MFFRINVSILKSVPIDWADNLAEIGTRDECHGTLNTQSKHFIGAGSVWEFKEERGEEQILYKCSDCDANLIIYKQNIQGDDKYIGPINLISTHNCEWWKKLRTTLKYLISLRKYIACERNQLKSDLGFLICDFNNGWGTPVMFVFGHMMIGFDSTPGVLLPLTYQCNDEMCKKYTVEFIEMNGVLCKLISSFATGSEPIDATTFSYDPNATNNLHFLDVECTTAYMIRVGGTFKHLFGNGAIDVIPHLEQILIGMGWNNSDLYAYKMSSYRDLDKNEVDDEIPGDSRSDDHAKQPPTEIMVITSVLRQSQQIEAYSLICLGEIFQSDYFEQCKSNQANQMHIDIYTAFKNGVSALVNVLRQMINERDTNRRCHEIIQEVIAAEQFINNSLVLLGIDCIICGLNTDDLQQQTIKNQTFKKQSGSYDEISTCNVCAKLIEAIYLVSSIEHQVKSIARSFVLLQPISNTNRMAAIFRRTDFKSMVSLA